MQNDVQNEWREKYKISPTRTNFFQKLYLQPATLEYARGLDIQIIPMLRLWIWSIKQILKAKTAQKSTWRIDLILQTPLQRRIYYDIIFGVIESLCKGYAWVLVVSVYVNIPVAVS